MRITLIILGVLVVIGGGVGLYLWAAGTPQEEAQGIAFPQAEDRAIIETGDQTEYPDRWEGYVETAYQPVVVQRQTAPAPQAPAPQQQRSPLASFISLIANRFGSPEPYTPPPPTPGITGDIGVAYEPGQYQPSVGVGFTGGSISGTCERFNPETGDICINGQRFNFRTEVTGAKLGAYVGALISNPSLGATLGTMLTSNMESGLTLSELKIEIRDGIPYFGGNNSLEEGGVLGSGAGAGGGGSNRFSGYAFNLPCTCREQFLMTILLAPASDTGTYLSNFLSLTYQDRGKIGFLRTQGRYTPGVSDSCRVRVSGTCETVPTTRGVIFLL